MAEILDKSQNNLLVAAPVIGAGGGALSEYVKMVNGFPILSLEEEKELARKCEEGDVEAAHKLVTSHLRLVVKMAYGFKNYGLPMMDIISEGNVGLMKAVKKFDVKKGFRLSTYAMWWIKAQIQEYVLKSWSLVKIGTTQAQKKIFFNLAKIKNKILQYDGEVLENDLDYISEQLGVSQKELVEMDGRLTNGDLYLYDSYGNSEDGEKSELIDIIPSNEASQEEILAEKQEKNKNILMLEQAMDNLNDREKAIVKARKLEESPKTLDDLSKIYSISKERVRQIEAAALTKIKNHIEAA